MRRTIEKFFRESGVSQAAWLRALSLNNNSLNQFRQLKGKGAGAANVTYRKAARFFEQKRILEGKPKSARRLEQEARWGSEGMPKVHDSGRRWVFGAGPVDPSIWDIEAMQDRQNARTSL